MQAILSVTLPFFALVLLGYLAARRSLLPAAAIPGLSAYVLFFALPCPLYRFGASMPFQALLASPRSRTAASWACRCWPPCAVLPPPGR